MCVFSDWRRWKYRERTADDSDVPKDFGVLGLYLLAISPSMESKPSHTDKSIVYIGMSKHVMKRLEKSHDAVKKIKLVHGLNELYYADFGIDVNNQCLHSDKGKVQLAYLRYLERKIIWEYANINNSLPEFNKD